jgi:hypothetical protein
MINFAKWVSVLWVICFLSGCATFSSGKGVTHILNNKERYQDKELIVSGVLVITTEKLAICEHEKPDDCLNLEMTRELFDELKADAGATVMVKGIYSDHEFRNIDGESVFYPSRLVVSEIIK